MNIAFPDATAAMHKEVRRRVEACLETGNPDQARTLLREYADVWPDEAKALATDIVPLYGIHL